MATAPVSALARRVMLPAALAAPGYVFSASDRVVGFFGTLVCDGRALRWRDALVCASQIGGHARAFERMCGALKGTDWRPEGRAWTWGDFSLELRDGETQPLHVLMSLGETSKHFEHYREFDLPRHIARLSRAAEPSGTAAPLDARRSEPIRAAVDRLLAARNLTVYSGAGLSRASGIPTFFGEGSLDARCRLLEPFPGELVAWMLARPAGLSQMFLDFHARLLDARPGRGHLALRQLEECGVVETIVTSNIDMLHEAAGSSNVVASRSTSVPALSPDHVLLVVGVSDDGEGVVARARAAGAAVVVVDRGEPAWLETRDVLVRRDAEDLLAALAAEARRRGKTPRRVLGLERLPKQVRPASRVPPRLALPDPPALIRYVTEHSPVRWSQLHGPMHWKQTAFVGRQLIAQSNEVDPAVILLFALIHDAERAREDADAQHGERAARLVETLAAAGLLRLSTTQRDALTLACALHSRPVTTLDPTIGACWDADRVCLWRIGVRPHASGLSTTAAADPTFVQSYRDIGNEVISWASLWKLYEHLS